MSEDPIINQILFDKYKPLEKIGKGSFGTVYTGINLSTQEKLAIKFETKDEKSQGLLESEAYKLKYLKGEGIPKIYSYGKIKTYNFLVMELLGKSLNDLFISQGRRFSLKTVCIIGIDMIKRIEYIHERFHLHRDIKPDNFMMGRDSKEDILYLIDFGLSKKYRTGKDKAHIPFKTGKSITGTARYCSVYTHLGYEQARRDDLESIGYVLLYFLRGNLPWQGVKVKEGEKHYEKIGQIKKATSTQELCEDNPEELRYYFSYVKQLEFEEEPNYNFLIELFEKMLQKYCDISTYYASLDWKLVNQKKEHRAYPRRTVKSNSKNKSIIVYNNCQISTSSNLPEQQLQQKDHFIQKLETYISYETNSKNKIMFDNKLTKIRKVSEVSLGKDNYNGNGNNVLYNSNYINNNSNTIQGKEQKALDTKQNLNEQEGNNKNQMIHKKTLGNSINNYNNGNTNGNAETNPTPSPVKSMIQQQQQQHKLDEKPSKVEKKDKKQRNKKRNKEDVHCGCIVF